MRTETLTIVFTDIKGYTAATSSQSHRENASMLQSVAKVIEPIVSAFNGTIVKSIGDAYMVIFRSPTSAVHCGTAIQDRLFQHNRGVADGDALHIRIAMNIGEVRVHRGDVFGEPVNIAARLEAVTPADEIYVSEAMYLTMNRSEISTEEVGNFDFKGIPDPVTAFRVKKHQDEFDDDTSEVGEAGEVLESIREASSPDNALPYGGKQLVNWQRLRWIRRTYLATWALAIVGLVGAAYLRYRPSSDYSNLVAKAAEAAEAGDAMGILGVAGQIPESAVQERAEVRRHRRQAAALLLEAGDLDGAERELDNLLAEDSRDPEALALRARAQLDRSQVGDALRTAEQALKVSEAVAEHPQIIHVVTQGYRTKDTIESADHLVEAYVKGNAAKYMAEALRQPGFGDRTSLHAIAKRLEKLGAGSDVDWVALYITDLGSTSCAVRRQAANKLLAAGDARAVGPLMKLAESRGCGAKQARAAASSLLEK